MQFFDGPLFWLSNLYLIFQIFSMALIVVMITSIMKPYAKKHGLEIKPHYYYIAILLYFIYHFTGFLIFYLNLTDYAYEIGMFTNIILLVSALLIYVETNRLLKISRVEFNAI